MLLKYVIILALTIKIFNTNEKYQIIESYIYENMKVFMFLVELADPPIMEKLEC